MTFPKLWVRLRCGWCGRGFTADPDTVPSFTTKEHGTRQMCRSCWDMQNVLRARIGDPVLDRPSAYPEDYPPAL